HPKRAWLLSVELTGARSFNGYEVRQRVAKRAIKQSANASIEQSVAIATIAIRLATMTMICLVSETVCSV
ncbi:MAG TPA: hypothetical protein VHB97_27685, partial [Polyangia bacterium]|nr:hypothetical protein [Polyangia bacterium]